MITLTLAAFHEMLKAQGTASYEHLVFICPICSTPQCAADLIKLNVGSDMEAVEKYIGFSCIGRWTNAGPFKKTNPPNQGCDWTLGGLFSIRELDVETEDGKKQPHFMPATTEQARIHWDKMGYTVLPKNESGGKEIS